MLKQVFTEYKHAIQLYVDIFILDLLTLSWRIKGQQILTNLLSPNSF